MIPPYAQVKQEARFRIGALASITVGEPGTHGDEMIGMQGIGVMTPIAAAVAAATAGFAKDWHTPNGRILTMDLESRLFATAAPAINTLFCGSTSREDGCIPKLHDRLAPLHTHHSNRMPSFPPTHDKTLIDFDQRALQLHHTACQLQCALALDLNMLRGVQRNHIGFQYRMLPGAV